jgi:hypothetical protein
MAQMHTSTREYRDQRRLAFSLELHEKAWRACLIGRADVVVSGKGWDGADRDARSSRDWTVVM